MRIPTAIVLSVALALTGATAAASAAVADTGAADTAGTAGTADTAGTSTVASTTATSPGTTVYVDCSRTAPGDGSKNSPISTLADLNGRTFGPGDRILFKSSTVCVGSFTPHGSGSAQAPIVATTYGGKDPATIEGRDAEHAVLLKDASYWTVDHLHLTNPGTPTAGIARDGIQVESSSADPTNGITITNCTIEKTAGWGDKTRGGSSYSFSGGIIIMMDPGAGPFNDVRITGNTLNDTGGGGIKVTGTDNPTKNTGVYVGYNTMNRPGGDGIVIHNSVSPLIEHNTALDLGQGEYPFTGGNFAGMWAYTSSNPTFQYNVVGNSTKSVYDATAWDCDISVTGTCLYQYNYSFGNAGGFFLDCVSGCGAAATQTAIVLRYNIAQDDCRIAGASGGKPIQMYNNTFYCPSRTFEDDMSAPRVVTNNIFVAPGGTLTSKAGDSYSANTYYGGITPPAGDSMALTDDPGLQAPGSGQEGLDLSGYRLLNTSDQLRSGVVVPDNGGRDFFGNAVSATQAPNRGAFDGAGLQATPLPITSLYNQTALASIGNGRNGAITADRETMSAEALADAGLAAGTSVRTLGATFTFHPQAIGRADNVKAAGQQVAIGQHADSLVFVGFASGGTQSGQIVVHYANGRTQKATLTLSDWHSTTAESGDQLVASAPTSLVHTGSYNDGTVQEQASPSSVFATSVPLTQNAKVTSVTLPAGSPFTDAGLHLFDVVPVIGH